MKNTSKLILNRIIQEQMSKGSGGSKKSGSAPTSKSKQIAKEIYNSKGYIWDDPGALYKAVLKIKSLSEYKAVTAELQKLTGGSGPAAYIRSILNRESGPLFVTKLKIADHLMKVLPKTDWWWTVKKLILYTPDITYRIVRDKTGALKRGDLSFMKDPSWQSRNPGDRIILKFLTDPALYANEYSVVQADLGSRFKHNLLTSLQTLTIPFQGPGLVISGALGLIDAEVYRREGDPKTAGLVAVFSLLPGLGPAARAVAPGIGTLGKEGMKALARKIASGATRNLSPLEKTVATGIASNSKTIAKELDNYLVKQVKAKAPLLKKIPAATKSSSAKTLTQLAKGGSRFAATLAFYLYGVPTAYEYVYDKMNPRVTQSDIQAFLIPLEKQITARALLILQQYYKSKSGTGKKSTTSKKTGKKLGAIGQGAAAAAFKRGKLESTQPVNEVIDVPAAAAAESGFFGSMFSAIGGIGGTFSIGALAAGVAVYSLWTAGRIAKGLKSKYSSPITIPFGSLTPLKLPKIYLRDAWRAMADIRNIRNVRINGQFVTLTKNEYIAALKRVGTEAQKSLDDIERDLMAGRLTPQEALIEYTAITPGRGYEKLKKYVEMMERGKQSRSSGVAPEAPPSPYAQSRIGFAQNRPVAAPFDGVWDDIKSANPDLTYRELQDAWESRRMSINDRRYILANPKTKITKQTFPDGKTSYHADQSSTVRPAPTRITPYWADWKPEYVNVTPAEFAQLDSNGKRVLAYNPEAQLAWDGRLKPNPNYERPVDYDYTAPEAGWPFGEFSDY